MTFGLYVAKKSLIHRLPAGVKVVGLILAGTAIFMISDWRLLALVLLATCSLYLVARIPGRQMVEQIRPTFWLLAIIFAAQAILDHWLTGVAIVARFAILILLASLVTLTTRVSHMIEAIETGMRPLAFAGINPAKVGLAISMAIRFIPVIAEKFREIREAQEARGLGRNVTAIAVPLVVRTLQMANDVGEALDARSFDPDSGATPRHRDPQEHSRSGVNTQEIL